MTPDDLQAFLVKHKLKEAELARLLGVPHQTVNRWKLGTRTPRPASFVDDRLRALDRQLAARTRRAEGEHDG
jgi:transcriptional regulator with XRE-family HTH domain